MAESLILSLIDPNDVRLSHNACSKFERGRPSSHCFFMGLNLFFLCSLLGRQKESYWKAFQRHRVLLPVSSFFVLQFPLFLLCSQD